MFLKLQPYWQHTTFKRAHQKLASQFFGLYPILHRVGKVAYNIQFLGGAHIHPIFHVSLLKKYVGECTNVSPKLLLITKEGEVELEQDKIIDTSQVKQGNKFVKEVLVQWRRLPAEEATWEDADLLKQQFPTMNLEDKVPLVGEGIDRPMPQRSSRCGRKNPKYFGMA